MKTASPLNIHVYTALKTNLQAHAAHSHSQDTLPLISHSCHASSYPCVLAASQAIRACSFTLSTSKACPICPVTAMHPCLFLSWHSILSCTQSCVMALAPRLALLPLNWCTSWSSSPKSGSGTDSMRWMLSILVAESYESSMTRVREVRSRDSS